MIVEQEEIYRINQDAIAYQESQNLFHLYIGGRLFGFKFCELMVLRKKISEVDLMSLFDAKTPDVEIIALPGGKHILLLTLEEVLNLRELLAGAFTMLELNHLLHESLYSKKPL